MSNSVGWTLPYLGPIGDVYRLDVSLRGDVYSTEGNPQTFSSEGGARSEGSPPAAHHRGLELAPGRRHRDLGARGRADGQRQRGADLRQHPQDPERGQHGLRVRRDQPVRAQPLPRPRPHRYRAQGRLRPALQLARAARHRGQRHLRAELRVHRQRVHPRRFRPAAQSLRLCRRGLLSARRVGSISATASGSANPTSSSAAATLWRRSGRRSCASTSAI